MAATQRDFIVRGGIKAPANSAFGDCITVDRDAAITQNVTANNITVKSTLAANALTVNVLTVSVSANIANASIAVLVAANATINNLSSPNATINALTVTTGNVNNLTANIAAVKSLTANAANVAFLTVNDLTVTGNSSLTFERGTLLRSYREYVAANTTPGATFNADLLDSNIFNLTIAANTAITISNAPNTGIATSFTLIVKRTAAGARISFPANTVWSEGIVPVQSLGINQTDIFTFMTLNAGALIIGAHSFANVS